MLIEDVFTPTGKIARLPAMLREEVNRRLNDGHTGPAICDWLNSQEQVKQVLADLFGGECVSPQNLSAWRNGGFRRWQAEQAALARSREADAYSRKLAEASGGNLAENGLAMLTFEVTEMVKDISRARTEGREVDSRNVSVATRALVGARAKELDTHGLRQRERRLEQYERALKLAESRFNLRFAETFLEKLDDRDSRAIASSDKPRETKLAELVKHWFGEMPEGIGPQATTLPAA